jgi:hypothetical protein
MSGVPTKGNVQHRNTFGRVFHDSSLMHRFPHATDHRGAGGGFAVQSQVAVSRPCALPPDWVMVTRRTAC